MSPWIWYACMCVVCQIGVCSAVISEPLPHYSLFLVYVMAHYSPHLSHFWALSSISGLFVANYRPHLSHFWEPKKSQKSATPVTLLEVPEKVTLLYSQSSCENATTSSGTSLVSHYEEVTSLGLKCRLYLHLL